MCLISNSVIPYNSYLSLLFMSIQRQKEELRQENDELRQKANHLKKELERVEQRNGCKSQYWYTPFFM